MSDHDDGLAWRVLRHGPADGAENMAVDHALAVTLDAGTAVLRLYEWNPATVSFGRNQPSVGHYHEKTVTAAGYGLVRRPTGGRAVLHDREVTYSVVVHAKALGGPRKAYRAIHEALCDGLRELGVAAELTPPGGSAVRPDASPCFADPAPGEIHVEGQKLVGSAQARFGSVILQHGSILLVNDQRILRELGGTPTVGAAPVGLTLKALGVESDPGTVADAVATGFARRFGDEPERNALTTAEREQAKKLEERYRSHAWTWRR